MTRSTRSLLSSRGARATRCRPSAGLTAAAWPGSPPEVVDAKSSHRPSGDTKKSPGFPPGRGSASLRSGPSVGVDFRCVQQEKRHCAGGDEPEGAGDDPWQPRALNARYRLWCVARQVQRSRCGHRRCRATAPWDRARGRRRAARGGRPACPAAGRSSPDRGSGPGPACPSSSRPRTRSGRSAFRRARSRTPRCPCACRRADRAPARGSCRPPCRRSIPRASRGH